MCNEQKKKSHTHTNRRIQRETDLQNRDDPLPVFPSHFLRELDGRDEVAGAA